MKNLLLPFIMISSFFVKGQITYTDIVPDSVFDISTSTSMIEIDFDLDNSAEFTSSSNYFGPTIWSAGFMGDLNCEIIANHSGVIQPLSLNDSVHADTNWIIGGHPTELASNNNANFQNLGDKYVGVRFPMGGNTHYGWIRVSFDNNFNFTIKDYAYHNTPNTPILAGDRGGPAVLVNGITVQGQGGASTITTPNGTLQMLATVLPANATNKDVDWEVTNNTGSATISNTGLLAATADGTVSVKATAKDGSGTVDSTTITISNQTTTGISTSNLGYDISIYPNPASDKLYIENRTITTIKSLKIVDITGKQMYRISWNSTLNSQAIEVNLKEFNKGIYFLQLTDEQNNTIVQKFHIQ